MHLRRNKPEMQITRSAVDLLLSSVLRADRIHRFLLKLPAELLAGMVLCAALLTASPAASAQDQPRHLTGTVTDPQHEPLAGAVVQLHDDTTDSVISYITDRTGRYRFTRVSPQDDFHVWAKFRDHTSRHKSISKFDSKPNRTIPLVIKLD